MHKLNIKDYVTVSEYKQYKNITNKKFYGGRIKVLQTLTTLTIEEIESMDVDSFWQVFLECTKALTNTWSELAAIKYKGEWYGYFPAEMSKIGDFARLENHIENQQLQYAIPILFRKIKGELPESFEVELQDGLEIVRLKDKSMFGKYKTKKYKYNDDVSHFDDFPWQAVKSALDFISGVSLISSIVSETYSSKEVPSKEEMEVLMEMVKQNQIISDGLELSSIYVELGLKESTEKEQSLTSLYL